MLLVLFHTITAIAVYVAAMPLPARLAIILLICLSLLYYLARDVLLLLHDSWCDIALDQNVVSVVLRDGPGFTGQLANKTVVSQYFVILRIRPDHHRLPVSRVIFPDALGAGEFRELRVCLKFA
ncbi:MAG: hypothetical protein PHP70_12705 [Gallionella sp.]|nr:hypothetical protein [Gallionella sp.]